MLDRISSAKVELLCSGVRLPRPLLDLFPGYRFKRASLSEGVCFDLLFEGCKRPVPINVAIHEKHVQDSPFFFNTEKGLIEKNGQPFVSAQIIEPPAWYGLRLDDGTPFQEIFQVHHRTILATSLTNFCQFALAGKACAFCALGPGSGAPKIKSVEKISQVLRALVGAGHVFTEVNINSGTLPETSGIELFSATAQAIRAVVNWPIYLQLCPPEDLRGLDSLAQAGIGCVSFNMEVFDESLRKELMPEKGAIPIDRYMRAMEYAVGVFGPGQVSSWLIAGLEPVESTMAGIRAVASVGAIPYVTVFRPLTGSRLENRQPPQARDMARVFEFLGQTLREFALNPALSAGGCVRCNCCSAVAEVLS